MNTAHGTESSVRSAPPNEQKTECSVFECCITFRPSNRRNPVHNHTVQYMQHAPLNTPEVWALSKGVRAFCTYWVGPTICYNVHENSNASLAGSASCGQYMPPIRITHLAPSVRCSQQVGHTNTQPTRGSDAKESNHTQCYRPIRNVPSHEYPNNRVGQGLRGFT